MAITPLASSVISGSPTFYRGCTNEANNEVLVVTNNNNLIRYSTNTYNVTSSSTIFASCAGVALINAASAVLCTSGVSQAQFYELSSGYAQTISAPNSSSNGKSQIIAGDPTTGTVIYIVASGSISLVKVTSSFTATALSPPTYNSGDAGWTCIINKSSGRWYLGSISGGIYEIDNNGNILNKILPNANIQGLSYSNNTSTLTSNYISTMVYDNNILTVGYGDGNIIFFDTTTNTQIYQHSARSPSQSNGTMLAAASGELFGYFVNNANPGSLVFEADIVCGPMKVYDYIYANSSGAVQDIGVNTQSSKGWWLQPDSVGTARIYFFSISGVRATTTRTFSVQVGGIDQKCRLILLDNTSGNTLGRPILDTYMQSPATYRVPTGKTIIEVIKIGDGESASWDCSQYST